MVPYLGVMQPLAFASALAGRPSLQLLVTVVVMLVAGLSAQIAAYRLGLPSIVLLLLTGIVLGPDGLRVIDPTIFGPGLRTILLQSQELPKIAWSPRLVGTNGQPLPDVDGWLDDVGIGLAVVPAVADTSIDDWEYSQRRQSAFARHGVLVLEFPAARLRQDPAGVRAEVVRAYRQRLRCGTRARATMAKR